MGVGWNYLLDSWSLGMDKWFHITLYNGCYNLSMLWLKLMHVSKMGHRTIIKHGFRIYRFRILCKSQRSYTWACPLCLLGQMTMALHIYKPRGFQRTWLDWIGHLVAEFWRPQYSRSPYHAHGHDHYASMGKWRWRCTSTSQNVSKGGGQKSLWGPPHWE